MFALLEKYRAWRLRRFLRTWAKRRAKGKEHFIPGFALYFSLIIAGSYTVVSLVADEPVDIFGVTVRLILNFLLGLLVGWLAWRSNEKAFLAAGAAQVPPDVHYPWGKEQEDDSDRFDENWKRDWQSMPHRDVVDLSNLNLTKRDMIGADAGRIISATISLAPEKYVSGLYIKYDVCPLCLKATDTSDRLAGSLHLTFEKLSNIGSCDWVHKHCFETLPLRDDLPGFPA